MKRESKSATVSLRETPRSVRPLARRLQSLPMLMLLAAGLCACTRSIVMIPPAPQCLSYVPDQLWETTPGASLPADSSAGAWVSFGNSQTGQLGEANAKPPAIRHIVGRCEQLHTQALAKAERDSKPWWRRIF